MESFNNTGNLFIVTAASGAGKTSLVKEILANDSQVKLSISHTTRSARPNELDGVHYHFVTPAAFAQILTAGGFLESADVHSAQYGTSQAGVDAALAAGFDIILEIDWQGAAQVRNIYPQSISIFILPPSIETLQQRLNHRNQDTIEVINKRVAAARDEMRHVVESDYVIINNNFDMALQDLLAIIRCHRLNAKAQIHRHAALVQTLT